MADHVTPLAAIVPGKIHWKVRVRIIRLWYIPELKNASETSTIEMIWLDEQGAKIHVSVKKALIAKFKDVLEEGCTYLCENLLVGQNDPKFKSTSHKYKLAFIGTTNCTKTVADNIPANHFDFLPFKDILEDTKEDKLIDVIGHIVEKGNIKEIEKNGNRKKLIDIMLQDLQGETVHCTLWADYANIMQQFLDSHASDGPIILILQLGKLKKFGGIMGVSNSFFGTKLLLNADIPEVKKYIERMEGSDSQLTQVVSQMSAQTTIALVDEFVQTPMMTIADLFECTHKCFGCVYATIIEIETENGWWYNACVRCMKRVTDVGTKHYCDKCKKMVTAVPSFKLQVQVMDDTGSAIFVMFDRVVSAYLNKSVNKLLDTAQKVHVPEEVTSFLNKQLLFKVEVNDANIYQNWQSFAVRKITDDNDIVQTFMANRGGNCFQLHAAVGDAANEGKPASAVEHGDSNNKIDGSHTDVEETPSSKRSGKRISVDEQLYPTIDLGETQASATKAGKRLSVDEQQHPAIDLGETQAIATKAPRMTADIQVGAAKTRKMMRVKSEKLD